MLIVQHVALAWAAGWHGYTGGITHLCCAALFSPAIADLIEWVRVCTCLCVCACVLSSEMCKQV